MKTNTLIAISIIAFIAGIGLGVWGWIKEDCISGPGCWAGSGFLIITGVILIIGGGFGMWKLTWGSGK